MANSRFWARGVPFVWGTSAMVILSLLLLGGMVGLILVKGLSHFWPGDLYQITTVTGEQFLGAPVERLEAARRPARTKYKIGNRDVYGLDFRWFFDSVVVTRTHPDSALALERFTHGDMFGYLERIQTEAGVTPEAGRATLAQLEAARRTARATARQIEAREGRIAALYRPLNDLERRYHAARNPKRLATPGGTDRAGRLQSEISQLSARIEPEVRKLQDEITRLREIDLSRRAVFQLADGRIHEVRLSEIARAWQPNRMSLGRKLSHYASGLWIFLSQGPREANTGGGVFPAIYGTVLMVLLMTVAVVPLGVVAALYLHEYARDNWFVRMVRLAVSNLAGVPSIVFGVFGLGFFIYFVGAGIDRAFFSEYLPSPTFGTGGILWASLTLALLTVPVVIVATEEGLSAVPMAYREGSLALGATKFQTIRKIVIPYATPGILTGVILAVSRGAGEVAPLMLTGVVPLVSEFPLNGEFPFLHLDRKFMHLGFHIYDVGFQSPNVEAVKPLVYSTTLVLIVLVVLLNALAIILRNRLRSRAKGSAV